MTVSAGVESLSSAYEEAELRIIDLIASRLKKGAEAPDWAARKLQELALTKRQIEKQLNKLAPEAVAQVSQLLQDNYDRGQAEALDTLIQSKMATPYPGVIQASKEMSKLLSETTQSILESHNRILRSTDDAYRKIVSRAASDLLLGTGTRSDMIQRGLNEFADKGITGFVDKRGRNWEMQAYVEMAAGTAAHRASTQGHLEKLKENGHNLVVVSDHKGECDQCRKWEGEVLAIEPVQDTPEPTYRTVEEARAAGLEHPGCRHRYSVWIEGVSRKPEPQGKPEDYEQRTQQRSLERQVRAWKRREAAGDPKAPAYVKKWQKELRDHVDEHGLKRRYDREKPLVGKTGIARPQKPAPAPKVVTPVTFDLAELAERKTFSLEEAGFNVTKNASTAETAVWTRLSRLSQRGKLGEDAIGTMRVEVGHLRTLQTHGEGGKLRPSLTTARPVGFLDKDGLPVLADGHHRTIVEWAARGAVEMDVIDPSFLDLGEVLDGPDELKELAEMIRQARLFAESQDLKRKTPKVVAPPKPAPAPAKKATPTPEKKASPYSAAELENIKKKQEAIADYRARALQDPSKKKMHELNALQVEKNLQKLLAELDKKYAKAAPVKKAAAAPVEKSATKVSTLTPQKLAKKASIEAEIERLTEKIKSGKLKSWELDEQWGKISELKGQLTMLDPSPKLDKLLGSAPRGLVEGVKKKGSGTGTVVNPHRGANRGYQVNCTRVTAASELRARGFDVIAAPRTVDDNQLTNFASMWRDRKTGKARQFHNTRNISDLEKFLLSHPDGSRFAVAGEWKRGGAHVWNVEVKDGKIIFREGQSNRGLSPEELKKRYYENLDWTSRAVSVLRMDDLIPTDKLLESKWVTPQ